ncbi:MAG: methyltransferase domain-containing protein [Bdellovibrionales bacterium]|nr:methyltransferase domain-containing protein [Bdellovibrionales bacterium]
MSFPLKAFSAPQAKECTVLFSALSLTETGFQFVLKLISGEYVQAKKIISKYRKQTINEVDELGPSEKDTLERHWSALYLGDIINTPLSALVTLNKLIPFKPGDRLIDIGSGHGHPILVLGALNHQAEFLGYEIVEAKVQEISNNVQSMGLDNVNIKRQDLSAADFKIPEADYYFIYNPVNFDTLENIILQIKVHSSKKSIKVIVFGKDGWDKYILEKHGFIITNNRDYVWDQERRNFIPTPESLPFAENELSIFELPQTN